MTCPVCGTGTVYEIAAAEHAGPLYLLCQLGHRFVEVRFRLHRYEPPLRPGTGRVGRIYCGPPADRPTPPTPDEILYHARNLRPDEIHPAPMR